jgi:simple sugar transport system permease protein
VHRYFTEVHRVVVPAAADTPAQRAGWGFILGYAAAYAGTWLAVLTPIMVTLALRTRELQPQNAEHWLSLVLAVGALFGMAQGYLVQRFRLQPFIVTLAGMFLARGLCYVISTESISIADPVYSAIAQARVPLGGHASLSVSAIIALAVVAAGMWIAHRTQFGRTVYALGGSEPSARLMGLPVDKTVVRVYMFSGFCAALGGVAVTFYMQSGYSLHAVGLELDAIAAVVIGGTLLRGGAGYVAGTLFGVLILGTIQTLITFEGTLSSWWTRIAVGALLFAFCLLQRLFATEGRERPPTSMAAPRSAGSTSVAHR